MGNWAKQAKTAYSQKDFVQAGDFYKMDGNYSSAVKCYIKGNRFNEAAKMHELLGQPKKAEKLLLKHGAPKDLAEFYLRNNNLEKATEIYVNQGMDFEAAELLEQAGDLARAADLYAKLKHHEKAGTLYGKVKNFDRAIQMFTHLVATLERDGRPNARQRAVKYKDYIANMHVACKRFNKAGEMFLEINQKEKAGKCFLKAGNGVRAAKILKDMGKVQDAKSILTNIQSRESRILLGSIAHEEGRWQDAVVLLNDTDQYTILADSFEQLGKFIEAAEALERAGNLHLAAGMYAKGNELQKAAMLFEQHGMYNDAAACYEKLGKIPHAAKLYHMAKNRFKAGECLFKAGYNDEALNQLQFLEEDDENHNKSLRIQAEIFFKQKEYAIARKMLEDLTTSINLENATMPTFYLLARSYEGEGNIKEAMSVLERIVAKRHDFQDARVRLKQLQDKAPVVSADHTGTHSRTVTRTFSPQNLGPGDLIADRFKILSPIGKGGMGAIFKVRDQTINRDIAIKILSKSAENFEELKAELLTARDLTHQYIIKVFDVGLWMGIGYFTMEYVDGRSLKDFILNSADVTLQQKIELLIKICEALKCAHDQQIVHRDMKPQNILVDAQLNPKILDFGIARKTTQEGGQSISGSPKYMAPEQVQNLQCDPRTDIYAMGIIMYYMFTLQEPFLARTPQAVMIMQVEQSLPEPLEANPDMPYWLGEIIKKCCMKQPDMRFPEVSELIDELRLNLMDMDVDFDTDYTADFIE